MESPGTRRCLKAAAAPGVLAAVVANAELLSWNWKCFGRSMPLVHHEARRCDTTHLDLVVKDVSARIVDDLALIQQSSSVLGAGSGGQKVGRR